MNKNLDFHLTFYPEREHIASLLALASSDKTLTKEEISSVAGIPTGENSGKVVPHIYYASYMGLIESSSYAGRFSLSRTDLGSIVSREDPLLLEPLTQVMCHYWLSSESGAGLWFYLWREFIPTAGIAFNEDAFLASARQRFNRKRVNVTPLKNCYTADNSLSRMSVLRTQGPRWTVSPHVYRNEMKFLYAYTLLREWETHWPKRSELTLPEIVHGLRWGNAYAWTYEEVLEVLSTLQTLGVVDLNRQLSPVTVIRTAGAKDIAEQLYSALI